MAREEGKERAQVTGKEAHALLSDRNVKDKETHPETKASDQVA